MAGYEIREMTANDIPQIAEIEKAVFPLPWSEADLMGELKNNVMAMYLVLSDEGAREEVLAYCGLWKIFEEGHITNIAVKPAAQGKKLGKLLVYAMIQWAWANGIKSVTLEVRENNKKAISMYKKAGFKEAGIRPGYYAETGENALIMWLHRDEAL